MGRVKVIASVGVTVEQGQGQGQLGRCPLTHFLLVAAAAFALDSSLAATKAYVFFLLRAVFIDVRCLGAEISGSLPWRVFEFLTVNMTNPAGQLCVVLHARLLINSQ